MRELEVMIGLIGLGFLLLMVGYSRRERDSGVLVMADREGRPNMSR